MDWIFDGIGTAITSFLLGGIIGSGSTCLVVRKYTKIKQKQIAKDNAQQLQVGKCYGETVTKSGK